MKILHLNAGNETGGGMHHILSLLDKLNREEFVLGVLEEGEMLHRARNLGIETVHFASPKRLSIPLIKNIVTYIKEQRIQVVHTHGPRANVYAKLLKKLVPFQWIVTVHSDPFYDFRGKGLYGEFLCRLHTNAIKCADRVIAISSPFQTMLEKKGVQSTKIKTVLNGIDFQKNMLENYMRSDIGYQEADFLFLMVARLEKVKQHKLALKAFADLLYLHSQCQLLLVGDGTLRRELELDVARLGITEHVHFLGHCQDVECFYRLADVTILTSASESFPLVLLESARAGTPVISTNVGGVKELITDSTIGWLVEESDITKAMNEAIFFKKEGKLQVMGEKLRLHASSKFSLEIFAENIYNVYLDMKM
ncbi:glycosyltransferase family 4 protein [Virgibacillus necropolis]|uniref:Glycosyltransferase n=1 Tax=Virgibacillus necropolis TaxID=163877 RepID=A0A221M925_9BACI|nr:glycosyltransferase family 4 protein [Virgibacillus necropolis]ASN04129.1 glycosyltransferase [Virgibacillus necropolis]